MLFEELWCVVYVMVCVGGDVGGVYARVCEYVDVKVGDVKGILVFLEY